MSDPENEASYRLADALRGNDPKVIGSARSDLGLTLANSKRTEEAIEQFGMAIGIAETSNDHSLQADILSNLGHALLTMNRASEAKNVLESAISHANSAGDEFAKKLILERYSQSLSQLGHSAEAISILDDAIRIARTVGDRNQEFRLLWLQAIEYAGMSQRNLAIRKGLESVGILRTMEADESRWYAEQLRKYRDEGSILSRELRPSATQPAQPSATGPGLLRMAFTATKAMASFLGSGMKSASEEVRDARRATCSLCEHHTGLRCRVCGCFTSVKSGMAKERCPLGRWKD